jgi:hypothetical protein
MPTIIVAQTGAGARFELDVNAVDHHVDAARIINTSAVDCVATVTSTIDAQRTFKHSVRAGQTMNRGVSGIVRTALGGTLTVDGYQFDAIFQFNVLPAGRNGDDF